MNKNEQIIREACIKANPEIMELKFGCQIHFIQQTWVFAGFGREDGLTYMLTKTELEDGKGVFTTIKDHSEGRYEILGRPIHLADVLLAIEKLSKDVNILVDSQGSIYVGGLVNWQIIKNVSWNLLQDDLSKQSEELKSFVANLLK